MVTIHATVRVDSHEGPVVQCTRSRGVPLQLTVSDTYFPRTLVEDLQKQRVGSRFLAAFPASGVFSTTALAYNHSSSTHRRGRALSTCAHLLVVLPGTNSHLVPCPVSILLVPTGAYLFCDIEVLKIVRHKHLSGERLGRVSSDQSGSGRAAAAGGEAGVAKAGTSAGEGGSVPSHEPNEARIREILDKMVKTARKAQQRSSPLPSVSPTPPAAPPEVEAAAAPKPSVFPPRLSASQ
jgi:hypothetical protein